MLRRLLVFAALTLLPQAAEAQVQYVRTLGTLAADPVGACTNGFHYYNSVSGKERCCAAAAWIDCSNPGTFANAALSNLSSVAINTSLLPGADNTIDLGSATKRWDEIWAGTAIKVRNGTLDTLSLNSGADFDITSDVGLTINALSALTLNTTGGGSPVMSLNAGEMICNSDTEIQLNPGAGTNVAIGLDGTEALPSLTLGTAADPNTGLYHPAPDSLGVSTAGTGRTVWAANGDMLLAGGGYPDQLLFNAASPGLQIGGTTYGAASPGNAATVIIPGFILAVDELGSGKELSIVGSPVTISTGDTSNVTINNTPYCSVETTFGLSVVADGSAATPSIALGNPADLNTGLFHPALDTLAVSNNSTETVRFTADNAVEVNASTAAVSTAGKARLRYNTGTNALQVSNNGGAYADLATGSGSIGGSITGGTQNSVLFIDPAATLAQDNANFSWDNANNQLLLGSGTASLPAYAFAGDANTGLYRTAADEVAVTAGGSQRMLFRLSSAVNGTPRISIPIGTLSGDGEWGVYETATFLSGAANNAYGFRVDATGAGNAAGQQHTALFNMLPGYTGTARNSGVWGNNSTAQNPPGVGDLNNNNAAIGVFGRSAGASQGYNFGVVGQAEGSGGASWPNAVYAGVVARSYATIVSGTSIGVFARGGHGGAGTTRIGGYFSNDPSSTPTWSNGALIADSAWGSEPIFVGKNNGTTRFTIAETGVTSISIDGTVSAPALNFGATSDPNTGIWHPGADTMAISCNSTEAVRFFSTANASFGTTSDLGQLGVDNGATAESILVLRDNGTPVFTVADDGPVRLGSEVARTIGVDRRTGATSGRNLTIYAGGAQSGATNANGGVLNLSGGITTGTGTNSKVVLQTYPPGGSGASDNTAVDQMTLDETGHLIMTQTGTATAPVVQLSTNIGFWVNGSDSNAITTSQGANTYTSFNSKGEDKVKSHISFAGSDDVRVTGAVHTTNTTQTAAYTYTLSDNFVCGIEAMVVGRRTDATTDRALYKIAGLVYRQGGGATLQGTVANVITPIETDAAWDATLTVTGNTVSVSVTGGSQTIDWVTSVNLQCVSTQ